MACFLSTCASTRRFGIPVVGGAGVRWGGLARTYLRWCPPLRASCRDEDRPRQPCGTGRRRRNAAWNASAFWRSAVRASRSASAALTSDSACAARARASTSAALLSRCRTRLALLPCFRSQGISALGLFRLTLATHHDDHCHDDGDHHNGQNQPKPSAQLRPAQLEGCGNRQLTLGLTPR